MTFGFYMDFMFYFSNIVVKSLGKPEPMLAINNLSVYIHISEIKTQIIFIATSNYGQVRVNCNYLIGKQVLKSGSGEGLNKNVKIFKNDKCITRDLP